jgi:4-hydroxy-2-oxoheptanedioate aldolase
MTSLQELWSDGGITFGGWMAIASSVAAEAAARQGFDYVCCDLQHGVLDYQQSISMMQATLVGGSIPVCRVPWNEPGIIGKMLDGGATGIIAPMINTRAEAEALVRSCRYAPAGSRSYGPVVASLRHDDYFEASKHVTVIPMIETTEAIRNLDDILSTPGITAIYVGPADLSVTLGLPPGNNDDRTEFIDALRTIVAGCRKHGIVPGIHSTGALAGRRVEMGFQMITVAGDLLAMRTKMAEELASARGAAKPAASKSVY